MAAQRDEKGHFLPGVSGCPGGRAKDTIGIRAELKKRDARALEVLDELLDSEDEKMQLEAVKFWGQYRIPKPRQNVSVKSEGDNILRDIPQEVLQKWAQDEEP